MANAKDGTSGRLDGMRVAFVVPPLLREVIYGDWDLSEVDGVSPPLGLLSLAAVIREEGCIPTIHDGYLLRISLDELLDRVLATRPDVVGVTTMTISYASAKAFVRKLKAAEPTIPVILGGVHITALPEETMADLPEVDFGVIREGEATIVELLEAIKDGGDMSKVNGILYRSDSRVVRTDERVFIKDMDAWPFPAWDILEGFPDEYKLSIVGTTEGRSTSLITSRGCPGKCAFCDVGGVGGKIRFFSADYVIRMLDYLISEYNIRDFLFYDDNFVTLKARTLQICEEIIRRGWKIRWSCCARVDMVKEDTLRMMKKAGCWQIEYGIESGSQKILDLMNKRIRLEQIESTLTMTKRVGIETRGNFIFGYLGETKETIEESIRFALRLDLDYFQQTFLTPYPGSNIYEVAERYGKVDKDFERMNNFAINFVPDGMTEEELWRYSRRAFRAFYFRPKIVLRQLARIRTLPDVARLLRSFLAFLKTIF